MISDPKNSLDHESEYDMMPSVIKLSVAKCKHCGNEWVARVATPKQCPKCKSTHWNKQRGTTSRLTVTQQGA